MKRSRQAGSSFDAFLASEGIREAVTAHAVKRVLAWQVAEAMQQQGLTKSAMAKRMRTSRSQLDRFLDPNNGAVLLETVQRAADVLGKRLVFALEDTPIARKSATGSRRRAA